MHQKRIFDLTLILFFLVIFSGLFILIIQAKNPQEYSIIEDRKLSSFSSLSQRGFLSALKNFVLGDPEMAKSVLKEQLLDRVFQQDIEKAASDQFPLRIQAIQISRFTDRQIINLAYSFLHDPAIPTDMQSGLNAQSGLYIMRDKSQIIFGPDIYTFDELTKHLIDNRIENYSSSDKHISKH